MSSQRYDVIVAGGGSAGVAAAIGAARAGARTLLLERGPCLGGAATLRNVLTYCGIYTREDPPRQVVYGVAEEVIQQLRKVSAISDPTRFTSVAVVFDPESVKWVLDALCASAGVDVRLLSQVVGARRDGDVITAIDVADHRGVHHYSGAAFVDATGEADLAAFAGAQVRYGNAGRVQNGTLGVRFGGIAAGAEVTRASMTAAITTAKLRGAAGPLYADRGLVARLPISGDVIAYVVDEDYDVRDPVSYGRAVTSSGRQAAAYLEVLRTIPGCADAYIVGTGPEFGTRESRHITGRYRLSSAEVLGSARFHDVVALGAWPIEYHPGRGKPPEWQFVTDDGYYDIPLRILQSADVVNLLAAGRVVDGDQGAGGSLRAMGTAFATGHAAGVAAALLYRGPDPAAVQRELRRQGAFLGR
ncbi:FAD-dependent oxidoreductase [Nocardia sp. SYP-A9097]|uniref:FAD-dependent oxidoreductase n=1 Tax=Nocardia sp. SYP-A9097 TaxID=2663237 RepID=UPI00129B34A8|nr:FAD-dependent oxidoreductase [Nocardia sp. SYP-A9097]MRH92327.1 FAD-dependent oxidoreductase [Nocardia sp. SYP-A9097]